MLIDTHDAPVCAEVWELYAKAAARFGGCATMIERDDAIPSLGELLDELALARGRRPGPEPRRMSLLERQIAFRGEIAAADDGLPPSSPGMAIYRDAYRGRLLAALEVSFERTRRWIGEEAFAAAAAHYVLLQPPSGWTLDEYGDGFPDVLAALFAEDREVAELAWLEWQMSQAFAARDLPELDPAELAAAGYGDADWAAMRFTLAAGFAARTISTNCNEVWAALADGPADTFAAASIPAAGLSVWRSGLSPRYRVCPLDELAALQRLAEGTAFGEVALDAEPEVLGTWLAQWLGEGIFSAAALAGL